MKLTKKEKILFKISGIHYKPDFSKYNKESWIWERIGKEIKKEDKEEYKEFEKCFKEKRPCCFTCYYSHEDRSEGCHKCKYDKNTDFAKRIK